MVKSLLNLSTLTSIIIGMMGISLMIIVHELGHFFMAKIFKVEIETFSCGFGPPIFKRMTRSGTNFQISAWIFGGFCKMKGQDDIKRAIKEKLHYIRDVEEGSLYSIQPLKRLLIYFFGPVMNLIFAFFCLLILFLVQTTILTNPPQIILAEDYPNLFSQPTSQKVNNLESGMIIESIDGIKVTTFQEVKKLLSERSLTKSQIKTTSSNQIYTAIPQNGLYGITSFVEPLVNSVVPFSSEKKAGLKKGDLITEINGYKVTNMFDILSISHKNPDFINLKVIDKDGLKKSISYYPEKIEGKVKMNFNLQSQETFIPGYSLKEAISSSIKETYHIFINTMKALLNLVNRHSQVTGTVSGSFSASQTIGELTTKGFAENFNMGFRTVLYLLAGISISLAFVNLLPIPALDGGYIIMGIIETFLGRTFNPKAYIVVQVFGFVLIGITILILQLG
ncbi:MAG: RIP metalloprotease RseP [Sphaerochaetaceae bacterium]|nr:RIP metalloprotease RseP [Sphaerochaetaceae bacterium]